MVVKLLDSGPALVDLLLQCHRFCAARKKTFEAKSTKVLTEELSQINHPLVGCCALFEVAALLKRMGGKSLRFKDQLWRSKKEKERLPVF